MRPIGLKYLRTCTHRHTQAHTKHAGSEWWTCQRIHSWGTLTFPAMSYTFHKGVRVCGVCSDDNRNSGVTFEGPCQGVKVVDCSIQVRAITDKTKVSASLLSSRTWAANGSIHTHTHTHTRLASPQEPSRRLTRTDTNVNHVLRGPKPGSRWKHQDSDPTSLYTLLSRYSKCVCFATEEQVWYF